MFIPEPLKYILGSLLAVIMALGFAARRYPSIGWLRPFDLQAHLTEEQRARNRRRGNRIAAAQFVLFGFVLLMGYLLLLLIN